MQTTLANMCGVDLTWSRVGKYPDQFLWSICSVLPLLLLLGSFKKTMIIRTYSIITDIIKNEMKLWDTELIKGSQSACTTIIMIENMVNEITKNHWYFPFKMLLWNGPALNYSAGKIHLSKRSDQKQIHKVFYDTSTRNIWHADKLSRISNF